MTVNAVMHVGAMRGRTRPHLMYGDDQNIYVVKFHTNIVSPRQLAAEYIATEIARAVGLSVPLCSPIQVPEFLIEGTPEIRKQAQRYGIKYYTGPHFCTRYMGSVGRTFDILPEHMLVKISNLPEFYGIFALDKWCSNADHRQAIFYQSAIHGPHRAVFIDQGDCFGGGAWTFSDAPENGNFLQRAVYQGVTNWDSFEPYLSRLCSFPPSQIWRIAQNVPSEWRGSSAEPIEKLVESLLCRRSHIHKAIMLARKANPDLFPNWIRKTVVFAPARKTYTTDVRSTVAANS
jgi:hypothetical protein